MSVTAAGVEYGQASVWQITMLCPRCGDDLDVVTQGRIYTREFTALVKCRSCRGVQQLMLRLLELGQEPSLDRTPHDRVALCGTDSGYGRHRRNGEKACDDCLSAHAHAKSDRKKDGGGKGVSQRVVES